MDDLSNVLVFAIVFGASILFVKAHNRNNVHEIRNELVSKLCSRKQPYKGFANAGNTCYLDSAIFVMLFHPRSITHINLIKTNIELKNCTIKALKRMVSGNSMGPLADLIEETLQISKGEEFDAIEIFAFLDKYDIKPLMEYNVTNVSFLNGNEVSRDTTKWSTNWLRFTFSDGEILAKSCNGNLSGALFSRKVYQSDSGDNENLEYVSEVKRADAFTFVPDRMREMANGQIGFYSGRLLLEEFIEFNCELYTLFGAICYYSRHYFVVFKNFNKFYLYDDMKGVSRISSGDAYNVLETRGIIYIYFKYKELLY